MADQQFIGLCRRMLELSGVSEGETVVVLSQGQERADYVEAFLTATSSLGAKGVHMRMADAVAGLDAQEGVWRVGETPLTNRPDAVAAIAGTRLLVDLVFLLHSEELNTIRASGTRVLTCIEHEDLLKRLMPTPEMTAEVDRGVERLRSATTMHLSSEAGTDLRLRVDQYPVFGQVGYPRNDGAWDHWSSSGMVYTYATDGSVDGTVVFAPGDIILPFKAYVTQPIALTIKKSVIVDVAGGFEADLLRDYMDGFADEDAYGIAHVGWGLNPVARWSALAVDTRGHGMEVRASRGNVLFSTGPNIQAGGSNGTACHLDMPMRGCSLALDDEVVVQRGEIVA